MILEGRPLATQLLKKLKEEIGSLSGRAPSLAFILVGDDFASKTYVRLKRKACQQIGITSHVYEKEQNVSQKELLETIDKLNQNPDIDGILIQLPLPSHLDLYAILSAIDPTKDVDGLHPVNFGKLLLGDESGLTPCTPTGILYMLDHYNISCSNKHVVIIGRSNIVGKPLAAMLMQNKKNRNATVTVCHSQTPNLSLFTKNADILIVAAGKAGLIRREMVKSQSVIIDVGINRLPDGSIVGDVNQKEVKDIVSAISPVPGGVGPLTITFLLKNTFKSYQRHKKCL